MKRRDALKAGAAMAAVPVVLQSAPAPGTSWKPAVFNAHQNETVIVLTELIIPATDTPGAKLAKVNEYIDRFLEAGPTQERDRFLAGLQWLDEYSEKQSGGNFVKLTPSQQTALLEALDKEGDSATQEGNRFFHMAKAMTARFYYQTEAGYKELNKGGVPGTFGCTHAPSKG